MAYPNVFLDPTNTVVVTLAAAGSAQAVGIKRGVRYRVVGDADFFINYGVAATANNGIYVPAKLEDYMIFAMDDSQGTDPLVFVYAAGAAHIYFTPAFLMPTFA